MTASLSRRLSTSTGAGSETAAGSARSSRSSAVLRSERAARSRATRSSARASGSATRCSSDTASCSSTTSIPRATTPDGSLQDQDDGSSSRPSSRTGPRSAPGAVILGGVRIAAGALVGAGAVVTKDVEPGEIVVGVPAAPRARSRVMPPPDEGLDRPRQLAAPAPLRAGRATARGPRSRSRRDRSRQRPDGRAGTRSSGPQSRSSEDEPEEPPREGGRHSPIVSGCSGALQSGERPDVALSHNSYAQIVAARTLGIPASRRWTTSTSRPTTSLSGSHSFSPARGAPGSDAARPGASAAKTRFYDGLKEELYLGEFTPDPDVLDAARRPAFRRDRDRRRAHRPEPRCLPPL